MIEQTYTQDQQNILHILVKHKGKANAISHTEIADKLGMNERTLRDEVRTLVIDHGIPCLSTSSDGYFIASTVDECNHSHNELVKRAKKILVRAKAVRINCQKYVKREEQLSLIKEDL